MMKSFHLKHLSALKVLIESKSVTEAAESIFITQSSMSNILTQFRNEFSDEIVIRKGNNLRLTALAENLIEPLSKIVLQMNLIDEIGSEFNPYKQYKTFNLAITHPYEELYLDHLVRLLKPYRKTIKLNLHTNWYKNDFDMLSMVKEKQIDAFLFSPIPLSGCISDEAISGDYVLVSKEHKFFKNKIFSTAMLKNLNYVLLNSEKTFPAFLSQIAKKDKHNIKAQVESTSVVLEQVYKNDLVSILPKCYIETYSVKYNWAFDIFNLPFEMPIFTGYINLPEHHSHDPSSCWLQKMLHKSILM